MLISALRFLFPKDQFTSCFVTGGEDYLMRKTIHIILLAMALFLSTACQPTADPAASIDLTGTSWMLSSLDGVPPLAGTDVFVEFGADGTLTGSDGCNRFNTTYTQDGAGLSITQPGASTLIACDEAVTSQAATFGAALAGTETFSATEQELVLVDGDGNQLAVFTAVSQELAVRRGSSPATITVARLSSASSTVLS